LKTIWETDPVPFKIVDILELDVKNMEFVSILRSWIIVYPSDELREKVGVGLFAEV
jgi:hypothetical protein